MSFKVFIQARMSSNRLPGKVLMPFNGKPIIQNVVDAVGVERAVVLTSVEVSDDPLVQYLEEQNIAYYRGALDNVFGRFCGAIEKFNPEWVMRICADSPLIPRELIDEMVNIGRGECDMVTNVFPRSFPKGHSVEIIRARSMLEISDDKLTDHDREHVTPYFYRHADRFKILSVWQDDNMSERGYAVDTREDYDRLTAMQELDFQYKPELWKVSRYV